MEAQRITLAMVVDSAGYDASPARVRLSVLADFTRDVSEFLAGDGREVDVDELDVAIQSGSVAIETTPILSAPALIRDLRSMLSTPLLDGLDAKRRKVVERWQKAARKVGGARYRIAAPSSIGRCW